MSSWEKWVFPQEVKASPSPLRFSRSPSPCSPRSPSPSNLSFCLIFFLLFLTSSTLKYPTKQCCSHRFLCERCEAWWRKAMVLEHWQGRNVKELLLSSICLTLNPHGGCVITDSCSGSSPRGSAEVKAVCVWGQEVHRYTQSNFCLLRSMAFAKPLWYIKLR